MEKEYLGDSVYVTVDESGQLVLTTENGFGPTNTIYLEDAVFHALIDYASRSAYVKNQAEVFRNNFKTSLAKIRCLDKPASE